MNPARWLHIFSVWRRGTAISDRALNTQAYAQVHAEVRGLFEALTGKRRETVLGQMSQAQVSLECAVSDAAGATVTLRPGDLVVETSGPGATSGREWIVLDGQEPIRDVYRVGGAAYQVVGLSATTQRLRP